MSNSTTVRRSSFYSLFFALLLVIVMPLSIVLVFFVTTASLMVREDYLSLNRQSVFNICDTLNASINSRRNLSYSLNPNPHVRKLANSSMDVSASELRENCQSISFILKGSQSYSSLIATAMKAYDQLRTEAAPILTENLQTLSSLQERRAPDQHKNHQVMENVQAYLVNGYANPALCLDMVADHLGVSYYFLSRILRERANMIFSDLLNDIRVRHAMELLASTSNTVQEISAAVDSTNWSTFLCAFRKRTGTTPVQYRKKFQTAAVE